MTTDCNQRRSRRNHFKWLRTIQKQFAFICQLFARNHVLLRRATPVRNAYRRLSVETLETRQVLASDFVWAAAIGFDSTAYGEATAFDSAGNVFVTGYFTGTADFDPSAGVAQLTSAGGNDVFVAKYSATGSLLWARQLGSAGDQYGHHLTVDSAGNVVVAGIFFGTADFDPGIATANLTSVGHADIFVAKLDSSGNYLWAKQIGGTDVDESGGIVVDSGDNILVTGTFNGTVDFDSGPGTANLTTSAIGGNTFVTKLDTDGAYVWAKQFAGASQNRGFGIAVDDVDNVLITGIFYGTADFDPESGAANLSSNGSDDVFVAKLNSAGNYLWAKQFGGAGIDEGNGVAVDSANNILVAGAFFGTADFDPGAGTANLTSTGNSDTFVAKLDSAGNYVWAKQFRGSGEEWGIGLAVDISDSVVITGFFTGTGDFDPGAATANLTSAGSADAFLAKLNSSGNYVWSRRFGSVDSDDGYGVAVDGLGNVALTGIFRGTVDFDPGAGTSNLSNVGSATTGFVVKLISNSPPLLATNLGLTLAEGGTAVVTTTRLQTTDGENSAAQLTYTVAALPTHGLLKKGATTLAVNGTFTQADLDAGAISYVHDGSESTNDQFTFTVTDGIASLPSATFALTITPVNDAPTAGANLGLTLAEGATAVINGGLLKTNDVDNSSVQLVYTVTNLPTHGTLSLQGTALATNGTFTQADLDAGRVTYAHDSSENFSDNFKFTVSDGEFTLSSATFALTITPVNDAPTAGTNVGVSLAEGSLIVLDSLWLKTNDVDNTAAQLVYTVTNLPTHGTLRIRGEVATVNGTFTQADLTAGRVSYAHDSSENFTDGFQFTVTDGEYTLPIATFALRISPLNDAPTAGVNLGLSVAEGATALITGGLLKTNDVDNTTTQLVYTVSNLPTHGTLALSGVALATNGTFTQADLDAGRVSYTHDSSESFTDSFKFRVSDGLFPLSPSTFALTITPVNDAPMAGANLGLTLAEGATASVTGGLLKTNDVDNSSAQLVYTMTNLPTHGTLNLNGAALATNGTFTQADLDAGRVSYAHDSSENFVDQFQFTASDGEFTLASATFALTITPVNDAPTAGANLGLTLAEGATAVVSGAMLKTNDVDNSTTQLVYTVANQPSHGTLNLNGSALAANGTFTQADLDAGRVTYTHDSSENFNDQFTFTVTDGEFTLSTATFALVITPVNDALTAGANSGLTLAEGSTAVITGEMLKTNDVDNTSAQLVYTVANLPTHGTLNLNGVAIATNGTFTQADLNAGRVSYTHDSSENFSDAFSFTVTDGEFTLASATFTLTITPVNDALTAGANLGLTLAEGATVIINGTRLKTNDVDNTSAQLVYTVTNHTTHGTVNVNGAALATNGTFTQADLDAGKITYTHDAGESVADQFQFTVTDGEFTLASATFALTIVPVNDAPSMALNAGAGLAEGATLVLTGAQLKVNDVDNSSAQLLYTVTNLPAHGSVNLNGAALAVNGTITQADLDAGRVSYTHDSSENFSDAFSFTVTDGEFTLASTTFALTITPVNDAPVVAAQNFILYNKAVAGTIVGTVQASDRDAGQQRSFTIVGGNGAFAINGATGVLTVVNAKQLVGTMLNFIVRVTDNGVPPLATDAPISVSLRAADAPPTFAVVDGAAANLAVVNNQVKLTLDEATAVTATRNGLVIATLAAADVDEPGVVFPLKMTDNSGAFAFDALTGKLSVRDATKLDFEKTRSFNLTFTATDHGLIGLPKPVTSTLTMTVQLTDRNDAPTITPATATFKLKENNGANTTVGTVTAVDVDGPAAFKNLQYAVVSQRDAAGNDVGLFSIDTARGTLKIVAANALNYEAQPQYTVVVRARDAGGLYADQTVTVQVIDVNEAVVLTLLDAAQNPATGLTVPENTAKGTIVGYLRIDNPDVTRAETFKITLNDNIGKGFAVGAFDAASRLAPITVFDATKLNFEAINKGQFTLNFSVADSGFLSNDGSRPGGITVNKTYNSLIADVNEAPTGLNWKTVGLPGGSALISAGTLFGTALGVDPDKTPQAFRYSLTPNLLNNDLFTIDPLTGQLRSSLALGRKGTFNLSIRVTDAAGLFYEKVLVVKT